MSNDAERWKDKYFKKLEEFEGREKSLAEHRHLLERVVVRVSLAAEGADRALDKELGALRGLLRQDNHGLKELGEQLERIEKIVLAMDEQRAGITDALRKAFDELTELLTELADSRSTRKRIRQFSKEVEDRADDLRELPNLLTQFKTLLRDLLATALKESDGASGARPGFFSRLFGGSQDAPAGTTASGRPASMDERNEALSDEEEDDYDIVSAESPALAVEVVSDATAADSEGQEAASVGFARIEGRIRTILGNLLSQLTLPDSFETPMQSLSQRLESGLNWYELVPTLDDVAMLIVAAVGKGQAEFEQFLQGLDERLAGLQAFLSRSQASQEQSRSHNAELEDRVRTHVSNMQSDVRAASDLDGLKSSVETHLDSIVHSIDDFLQKEAERELGTQKELEEVKARLAELEAESTAMKVRLKEEQRRALTDVLTQLPNRMALEARASEEYDRWRRYQRPLSIVVCDIDFFKRINDNYGHLAGDRVLQLIAKEVSRRVRTTDFLARYGGEEFVILLPETESNVAAEVMEKTREMVSRLPFHFRNEKVQVTMSFGVTQMMGDDTIDSALDRADKALYRAKESGRNQVQLANPESGSQSGA